MGENRIGMIRNEAPSRPHRGLPLARAGGDRVAVASAEVPVAMTRVDPAVNARRLIDAELASCRGRLRHGIVDEGRRRRVEGRIAYLEALLGMSNEDLLAHLRSRDRFGVGG